ncbi:TPA: hypothetical protein CPT93_06915, partial [Candidatus Gastranaerophilales bacterium HUM_7]
RSFKVAKFSKGCTPIDGIGCVYVPPSYSPIKAGTDDMKKYDPKYDAAGYYTSDNYWAGAKKACDELGMSLTDDSKLRRLAKKTTAEKEQLGLPTSGWFWSSTEHSAGAAYMVYFTNGETRAALNYNSSAKVLCVGD